MLPQGERTSLLQAEVHYRSTHDVNRFTILLNNMRLMGIFDWWTAVLQFISQSTENPNPPQQKDVRALNKLQGNRLDEGTFFTSTDEKYGFFDEDTATKWIFIARVLSILVLLGSLFLKCL